jgi:hypothetical protein
MATSNLDLQHAERIQQNYVYRDKSQKFIYALILIILANLGVVVLFIYLVMHRPLPAFYAVSQTNSMQLNAYDEPNLLPDTILRWAGKAAVSLLTLDFANYANEIASNRDLFTENGWIAYQAATSQQIKPIVQGQLFKNAVINGQAVIGNEGPLPGYGYTWRVQIPMTLTDQSANSTVSNKKMIVMLIVKVPTTINSYGIGIESIRVQ